MDYRLWYAIVSKIRTPEIARNSDLQFAFICKHVCTYSLLALREYLISNDGEDAIHTILWRHLIGQIAALFDSLCFVCQPGTLSEEMAAQFCAFGLGGCLRSLFDLCRDELRTDVVLAATAFARVVSNVPGELFS
jgi:hypothetical protein